MRGSRGPAAGGVPVCFCPPTPPSLGERGGKTCPLLNDINFSRKEDAGNTQAVIFMFLFCDFDDHVVLMFS